LDEEKYGSLKAIRMDTERKRNERKTNEHFTRTIRKTHDTRNERTIHERTKWNERTIRKTQTNERTIQEAKERYTKRTNHWSVAIYYPMTNEPGPTEVQYSIVLLFEW